MIALPPLAAGGSHLDLVLLGVLVATAMLLLLAYRTSIPYPILFVVGGAAMGFVPGLPEVALNPDIVLVIVLPPLLYAAAFFSSLHNLRDNARPIGMLSIGLVVVTTVAVAVVAHAVIDGMPWAAAFVLGAVVAPTDPVAATAIASRLGAPRQFVTIVEGEALVNDSTALIAYKFAVAAVVTGSFTLHAALGQFVLDAVAGIGIGLVVGVAIAALRRRIDDAPIEISISLITPYLAYLPAEALGVSAVLAAVTAGIYLGWHSPRLITPATRIQAYAFWEILVFVLNAVLFVLVGLQLHGIVDGIAEVSTGRLVGSAVAISATVVAVRFAWSFALAAIPDGLGATGRRTGARWQFPFLVGWTGMRGSVSLAAALAIPITVEGGEPFPQRDLIVFLTFTVIFTTLVLQGLTLPRLIRWLGVEDPDDPARRESKARLLAARAALERLEQLAGVDWVSDATTERMKRVYEFRVRRFTAHFDDDDDGDIERGSLAYQRLRREALEAERATIVSLRNDGRIDDEIMRRIERDLDLEDTRLDL